ncbi:hypothetical protein L6164_025277 [Bauhinia variegata]|uniref:Uncharacterized protein n=1 Tax=Bauhinia variegata TaxID=167791 RepID=A0ACB9M0F7_BAUVA|nr:hypothetical protein L6164_025277 [Bauhinia variegata]
MYLNDFQDPELDLEDDDNGFSHSSQPPSCSQGHRVSFNLQTQQGGSICFLCFSNLISNPLSPTIHVTYALSQLSRALSEPQFLNSIITLHPHFLVSPLVNALSSFDDEPIASQLINVILALSDSADASVYGDFVARISNRLSSCALGWSYRQLYMYSEEIRGEILFVLYKISILESSSTEGDGRDILISFCPKLLYMVGDALMKTQSDDVRLNCVALLAVLARRHAFSEICAYENGSITLCGGDSSKETEDGPKESSLVTLIAEAIKGPLLSSDSQVQISTLDLLYHYLSSAGTSDKQIQILLEENIADYVFEILRLSGYKDPAVKMCLEVLYLLSTAEEAFKLRLVVGFSTLIPALCYVAEVPFHPVQCETLKLIFKCISGCPGTVSPSQLEELVIVLTKMLTKHSNGEMGMLPETFIMVCSVFVALIKSPSFYGALDLSKSIEEALKHATSTCLYVTERNTNQILNCLYLLKEAYTYTYEANSANSSKLELGSCILDICRENLLPGLVKGINDMEEEAVLGFLETFHSILLLDSNICALELAKALISSSWFSFSYGCLGLFTGDKMKYRIYLLLSSLMDVLLGNNSGQPIRDAALYLSSDPVDLLFLLGQRSKNSSEMRSCQSAVLLIMYTSSLYDERLADEKLVLASVEQYILVNSRDFQNGATDYMEVMRLVNLYSFLRGLDKTSCQLSYSQEAEAIIFQFINEEGWDLLSARIHPVSLKWLFQQENIIKSLCNQILKFSTSYSSEGADILLCGNYSLTFNVQTLGEIASNEDNYGARLLICLLTQLVEEEGQEHEIIAVLNLIATVIHVFPAASDQLCLHGIGTAIRTLCYSSRGCLTTILMSISVLVFNILSSVQPEMLSADRGLVAVTMKISEYFIPPETIDIMTSESLFVISILCLILHHSTNKAFEEASKPILFNTCIISMVNTVVSNACSKGPALLDHDMGTSSGETLVCVLILHYFAIKSLHATLSGIVEWQSFLDTRNPTEPLAFVGIRCHDLLRLLHFGSLVVKIIASYSLLELFTRISDQLNRNNIELKCTSKHLRSLKGILEGLVFYNDLRVATNCALCLSILVGWEKLAKETQLFGNSSWCRLITEEMSISLAAPCVTSRSFINSQNPAVHVVIALLKLHNVPGWMRSVFNDSCISGILENLAANTLSSEILVLFRELLKLDYLNTEQIATLNQLIQVRRKCMYTNNGQDSLATESQKVLTNPSDLGEVCEYLFHLMASETHLGMDSDWGNKRLYEEIELFFRTLTVDDDSR